MVKNNKKEKPKTKKGRPSLVANWMDNKAAAKDTINTPEKSDVNLTTSGKALYKQLSKNVSDLEDVVKWNTSDGDMLSFVMTTRKSLVILANIEMARTKDAILDLGIQ